jgi:hypothetical protein
MTKRKRKKNANKYSINIIKKNDKGSNKENNNYDKI